MDGVVLQDCIARGLGHAGRAIGVLCDAYRPSGTDAPLDSGNRFLCLSAAFNARDPTFRNAAGANDAVWYGVFDSAYLLAGDYLVERLTGRTWFVAALQNLLPPTCVLTNRVLTVTRPSSGAAAIAGVNAYNGGGAAAAVVGGFPASLLHGGASRGTSAIPADARAGGAVALMPPIAGVVFARGDLVGDDLGRNFVVGEAEENGLGWRLELRQAAS
jgi:hypothetical protein